MGGGEDSFSLVFENSIVLIKCTLYDTVFQRQVSICRGVVFSYSFSIYCAAYHGIWCSVGTQQFGLHWARTFHVVCFDFIPIGYPKGSHFAGEYGLFSCDIRLQQNVTQTIFDVGAFSLVTLL